MVDTVEEVDNNNPADPAEMGPAAKKTALVQENE